MRQYLYGILTGLLLALAVYTQLPKEKTPASVEERVVYRDKVLTQILTDVQTKVVKVTETKPNGEVKVTERTTTVDKTKTKEVKQSASVKQTKVEQQKYMIGVAQDVFNFRQGRLPETNEYTATVGYRLTDNLWGTVGYSTKDTSANVGLMLTW